jgi:TonB-linked SusC/RagA family outer membrane protein
MRDWGRLLPTLALLAVGLFAAAPVAAQTGSVTGTILDSSSGAALDAVQVSLETVGATEATLGGLTSATGRFLILNVPVGQYVLRAQLLGFGTQTQVVNVTAGQAVVVDIRLNPEAISLSEIVVTGVAGATQRTKLPFDVAQIRVADLPVPTVNAAQAISGKVAGAMVVGGTGRPGSAPNILLRGVTALNASGRSQDPLYIVDGVILSSSMVDLDALDIQSIEVVKGAAAASLYGSRAASGVIQIRTRRGAEMSDDQVRYSIRSEYGRSELGIIPDVLLTKAHEFALNAAGTKFVDISGADCDWLLCSQPKLAGQTMALRGDAQPNEWNTYMLNVWPGKTYDQIRRFFTNGVYLSNNLTVDGRSGRTNFHASFNNTDEAGVMMFERGFKRNNFRLNVDQAVMNNLTVQSSVFYSRSKQDPTSGSLFDLTRMPAGVDLLGDDPLSPGELVLQVNPTDVESPNPLYAMKNTLSEAWRGRFLGSVVARYSPMEWLKIDANVSFDRLDTQNSTFREKGYRTINPDPQTNNGTLSKSESRTESLNSSITASAVWNPTPQIRNTTQARYLYEQEDYQDFNTGGNTFAVAQVPTLDNIDQSTVTSGSYLESIRADGYFVITNFDMYDKYVLDALIRNDGSSLFGEDQRRQWYYRIGGAWRLSQEDFFNVDFIDEMKFRYSLGTAGGRPRFSAQYETYSVGSGRITPVNLGNKDLKPEFSKEQEVGMDLSVLNYKAILSLTYAQTTTEDQILQVPQAAFTGFSSQWRNAGTLESKTWEATVDLRLVERPSVNWSAKLLFDHTKTTITELGVPPFQYGTGQQGQGSMFYARAGEEIGTFYGVVYAKSCKDLPSDVSCDGFVVNDDGFLVWTGGAANEYDQLLWGSSGPAVLGKTLKWGTPFQGVCTDRVTGEETVNCPLGNTIPDFNLGLANTVSFKGLTLYALLSHQHNFDMFNEPLQWGTFKRWTGIFDQRDVPEAERKPLGYYDAWYGVSGLMPSNVFVEDGTFTKLREVSLSYRVPVSFLSKLPALNRLSGVAVNVVGRNLFTWTDYRGYDPDSGHGGGNANSAVVNRSEGYNYPQFRTFTGSIEIIF